jgi:uncharacterized phage protein (TIGR01671 family)
MTGCEQREIKFRAWHKKKNKMYQVYRMCFADYQEGVFYYSKPYADGRSINAETGDKDIIIMQFTGLKDLHGKEIYEGDVVRTPASADNLWEIYWHNNGFCLGRKRKDKSVPDWPTDENGYVCYGRSWDDIEVIGNIYENPELLEQAGERNNP